jgi:hypothetical protein
MLWIVGSIEVPSATGREARRVLSPLGPIFDTSRFGAMRKAIFGLLFTLLALQSYGANWFVRAGASGSNNGADWNNAWSSFSQIGWASLQPGDTIYVAAGAYGQLALGKSGTTAAPITLKRAFVGDIGATSAPGWNAATMDGRVVITAPNNGDGIILGTGSGIHYFTIDGGPGALQDQNSKFLVNFGYGTNPSGSGVWSGNSPTDHIILRNITCWDAGSKTAPQSGPVRGYDITGSPLKSDYTLQYCESGGGGDQNIFMGYAGGTFNNILVEHCVFRDSGTTNVGNVAGGDGFHPNAWSNGPAQNMIIRYCRVFNMTVEGIFFNYNVTNGWCYDNVIYQGPIGSQSGARAFECSNVGTYNNLNIYNNTIVGLPLGARLDNAGSIVNCRFANNIVWNSGHSFAAWMVDHNCLDGADPFLNSAVFDYHLKAGSPAIGMGAKLGAKYATDMDGVTRGKVWDAGAYAAVESAPTPTPTPTPAPTPTPTPTPSPTPTPTPAPTPTPTPTPTPSPSPTATPSSTPTPTPTATPTPGSTPKFVQAAYGDPHTATSIPVRYSGAQTGGNLNVVVVGWNDTIAQVSSVKDSAGNAYQLAVGPTKLAAAGGLNQSIYYAKNIAASGANTVTVTFNQTAHYPDVRILEYSGIDRTNPVDVIAAQTQSSGAICTSGNVATTNPTDLLVAANTIQTFTAGPGATFTERVHSNPDGQIAEDRVVTTAGLYSAGAALSSPGAWVMQMVAFRAAGSQPSTTASAQTTLTQNLAGMNRLCPSGLPIAPAVRSWLLDECKLIKFGGPELDRTLGMAAHSKVQHNGSLLFPGRGAA